MPTSNKYVSPETPLPAFPTKTLAITDRQNAVESYVINSLNTLDDDVNRLEGVLGVAEDAAEAQVAFTSNRIVADGQSLVEAISTLDANMLIAGNTVEVSAAALTGTVYTVDGTKTFTVDTGTDVITCTAHGLIAGQPFQTQTDGAAPSGLPTGTTHYAGTILTNSFKAYPTKADAIAETNPINITTTGSGTHTLNGAVVFGDDDTTFTAQLSANKHLYIPDLSGRKVWQISSVDSASKLTLTEEIEETSNGNTYKQLYRVTDPLTHQNPPISETDASVANELVRFSQIATLGLYPKGYITGPPVKYTSAGSVTIPAQLECLDSTGQHNISFTADTVISMATSGAGGLLGTETSNSWLSLYALGDSTGVNDPSGCLSTTNESVSGTITLPTGYDLKRQLPIFIRNDASSNFLEFMVGFGWPYCPFIFYVLDFDTVAGTAPTEVLSAGAATSPAAINLANFVPPNSQMALLKHTNTANGTLSIYFRPTGATAFDRMQVAPFQSGQTWVKTNTSQSVDYKLSSASFPFDVAVYGFVITEVP